MLQKILEEINEIPDLPDGIYDAIADVFKKYGYAERESVPAETLVSQPSEPLAERYYMNFPKDRKKILDAHHYELFTNEKSAQENLSRVNYLEPDNFETVVIVIDNRERRTG